MEPYVVSQMSDEEISKELQDRWAMIIYLLAAAEGEVRVSDEILMKIDLAKSVIASHYDHKTQERVYRLSSL